MLLPLKTQRHHLMCTSKNILAMRRVDVDHKRVVSVNTAPPLPFRQGIARHVSTPMVNHKGSVTAAGGKALTQHRSINQPSVQACATKRMWSYVVQTTSKCGVYDNFNHLKMHCGQVECSYLVLVLTPCDQMTPSSC